MTPFTTSSYWDTAETAWRILRCTTMRARPAYRALLDLPSDWPICRVTTVDLDLDSGDLTVNGISYLTAAAALRQLTSGDIDPDEVLEYLKHQGALRPTRGVVE